jgi:sulfur carrier protein ThiS
MSRLHDAARADVRTIGVSVTLSAGLRRLLSGSAEGPQQQQHTLTAGATLGDLLAVLGVGPAIDLTAAVDGELAERDSPLRDGAQVMLLVAMEGGAAAEGEATIRRAVEKLEGGAAAEGEATIRKAFGSRPFERDGRLSEVDHWREMASGRRT